MKASRQAGIIVIIILLMAGFNTVTAKPAFDFDWYGYVKLDASYDQNPTSHGNFVMWAQPQSLDGNDAQFNMTHKSTRLGMKATGKEQDGVQVGGNIEFDMYGGGPENKALLLLRHAFFTVQSGQFKLLAGQSWDLIAPLNPSTLNYPVMWGGGNIQYRRPQISLFYTITQPGQTNATLAVGLFRTIGNDLTPTFSLAAGESSDGSDDGTDAAVPSIQSRLDVTHKFASGGSLRAGVSGLWGSLKSETNLGNYEKYESWVFAGHLMMNLTNGMGFSGEVFTGSNLGAYFGGVLNGNKIEGLESTGGWASAWIKPSQRLKLTTGFGIDNPKDDYLTSGSRSKNQTIFGNVKYELVSHVTVGLEISQWETSYVDADKAKALRFESSFILNF